MSKSKADLLVLLEATLKELSTKDEGVGSVLSYFYEAQPSLSEKLDILEQIVPNSRRTRQERGRVLEQIAYLAVAGVKGVGKIKSFVSAGPQYDLLAEVEPPTLNIIREFLFIKAPRRDILVECKATVSKIDDSTVARMASILDHHLMTAGLGIFFSLKGATGDTRKTSLQGARLRQTLFYVRKQIPIVVFDWNDLVLLSRNGSFLKLITQKIRALAALRPELPPSSCPKECKGLPSHLAELDG